MRYIKYNADTEDRCLRILSQLDSDDDILYLIENMIRPTIDRAKKRCVLLPYDDTNLPVSQGVVQCLDELLDVFTGAREVLRRRSEKKTP